jgi:arsenite-transporting ATPase
MADTQLHFTTPMMQLQDPAQTRVLIVTLAETTPVLEAAGLQADLRRAGIEPWAWIINNSLSAANPRSPLLRQRALNEHVHITAVANQHAHRYAVVPFLAEEPIGVARLKQLTQPAMLHNDVFGIETI